MASAESERDQFFGALAKLVRGAGRRNFLQTVKQSIPGRAIPLQRVAVGAGRQASASGTRALRRASPIEPSALRRLRKPASSGSGDAPPAPGDPGYDPNQDPTFGSVLGPQYNPYTSSYEPAGSPVPDAPDSWAPPSFEPDNPEGSKEAESNQETGEISMVHPAAMMEDLGRAAAEAGSEAEAEAMAGAMVPLALSMMREAAPALMRAAPGLVCGVGGVVRSLHRRPVTRPLIRAVPSILRRTAASVARQASEGAPVPPPQAVRTLASQTVRVLGSPKKLVRAFRRSQRLCRCN